MYKLQILPVDTVSKCIYITNLTRVQRVQKAHTATTARTPVASIVRTKTVSLETAPAPSPAHLGKQEAFATKVSFIYHLFF